LSVYPTKYLARPGFPPKMPIKDLNFISLTTACNISGCGEFIPILTKMMIRPGNIDILSQF